MTKEEVQQLIRSETAALRDVVNAHSKTIKQLHLKIKEMELILDVAGKKTKAAQFAYGVRESMKEKGSTDDEIRKAMEHPLFAQMMGKVTK